MKKHGKWLAAFSLILIILGLLYFDVQSYFSLSSIKESQANFQSYYDQHPILCVLIYFFIYLIVTTLSIPGAAALTLLGGALFGLFLGTVVVSFASSIGATLAFLVSRFIFRDTFQRKFYDQLEKINDGIKREGAFYLFTLRLVPLVPFFIINLVFGLTKMKTLTFYLISQLGMLLGTIVYVNAGTELAKINSLKDITSLKLFLSFTALGLFPFLTKKIIDSMHAHKVYKNFKKPNSFEYNVIAIGAGAAGLVTSYIASATKAKVALIEKHRMGGDCLNTGCVPSKALIRTAKFINEAQNCSKLGIESTQIKMDFSSIMSRVQRVIKKIEPHDSIDRYTKLGVDCIAGEAQILSPWEVNVNGRTLTTKNIIIATGARPFIPPIKGIENVSPLTSENLWDLKKLPEKFLVLGGGAIGCELAQSFARLGSSVTQLERSNRLLPREDQDVSDEVLKHFIEDKIRVLPNHEAVEFLVRDGKKICVYKGPHNSSGEIEFDEVLVALGRQPNVKGFGLEKLGIELTGRENIKVNEFMQTNYPNIYACGDVAGPYQFTHTAAHQAWFATVNALLKPFYSFKVDYTNIPWCTYTSPEVARVGLSEMEALEKQIPYEVFKYSIDDLDRAIADDLDYGFVKVLTPPKSDKILGVTIVGASAGEIITEFILAKKYGLGLNKILSTIHIYPTLGESNKYVAGIWKKAQVSPNTLKWVEKFQNWRRS